MVTVRGKSEVRAYMAAVPVKMEPVLHGASRAGGRVFAVAVEDNTTSEAVRAAVRLRTKTEGATIKTTVDVKPGWARSVANWLEWGTSAHFISVDDSQRGGRSVGRINQLTAENDGNSSLVIGGKFVGATVWHPGARPHPVFRPAQDLNEAEAIAAAQSYINARVSRKGIIGGDAGDEE